MILPHIEQSSLYNQITFTHAYYSLVGPPMNPVTPLSISQRRISTFLCPSDKPFPGATWGGCNYGASLGPNLGYSFPSGFSDGWNNGMFCRRIPTAFGSVGDGLTNTIMIGEYLKADNDNTLYSFPADMVRGISFPSTAVTDWIKPSRTLMDQFGIDCLAGISNHTSAAGQTWAAPTQYDSAINTIVPPNWKYPTCHICPGCGKGDAGGVFPARSRHPGGAMHAMGDGSVRFISSSTDYNVYQALGSRNGQEAISPED